MPKPDYRDFRESERAGWSARAATYGTTTARGTLQAIPALLQQSHLFPEANVLDFGCGCGEVSGCVDILGGRPLGIDFSGEMVAQARRDFPHLTFKVGDVEQLDLDPESFDAALGNMVLFHVTNPKRAIAECHRVLKPGGRLAFSQWLGPEQSDCYRLIFNVLKQHADMSRAEPAPNAYELSDAATAERTLIDAGFTDVQRQTVDSILHAPGPSFFDFFMRFGVRVPLIVERQSTEVQRAIRAAIDASAAAFFDGQNYRIPMPSVVYGARKS